LNRMHECLLGANVLTGMGPKARSAY